MAPKRQHKTLSLSDKCSIIEKLERNVSGKQLAYEYGVGAATISDIKRKKENILRFILASKGHISKRYTLKNAEYPEMETMLHKWFLQQRDKHVPISEEILIVQAKKLFAKIYGGDRIFNGSRGWISKFRKRYGIRNLKICGEKLSSNTNAVKRFLTTFRTTIRESDLLPCQIYNADESGLYWKLLPEKTLVGSKEKTAPGRKTSKERVTFLACANATGSHRLKLLVIGKSKKPRSFGSSNLPVEYDSTANAWMTAQVFKNWFFRSFIPQVKSFMRSQRLPERALLLLDNAPSHPSASELRSADGMISTIFLPPNYTPLIQPMDQNVIRITKLRYKLALLNQVMAAKETDIMVSLKKFTLRDALFLLNNAWEDLKEDMIKNCWKVLMTSSVSDDWDFEDELPLAHFARQRKDNQCPEIQDILRSTEEISRLELTSQEVSNWLDEVDIVENPTEDQSDEEAAVVEEQTKIRHQDAINALNLLAEWAQQNRASTTEIVTLYKLKQRAISAFHATKTKQTLMTNFLQCM